MSNIIICSFCVFVIVFKDQDWNFTSLPFCVLVPMISRSGVRSTGTPAMQRWRGAGSFTAAPSPRPMEIACILWPPIALIDTLRGENRIPLNKIRRSRHWFACYRRYGGKYDGFPRSLGRHIRLSSAVPINIPGTVPQ